MNFSKSIIAITGLTLLASCGSENQTSTSTTQTTTQETATQTTTTTETTNQTENKTETISYNTPAGPVSVTFSTTENNDTITTASVEFVSGDTMSQNIVENFSKSLANEVVGKNISEIEGIKAIGGASLTTAAFVDFIN